MAASLSTLSASVTRILSLTGFPKELKTKDIQSAFSEYDGASGGFRIKWIDDTSLYIVFNDPVVAKRAYLRTLAFPPPIFSSPTHDANTTLKPYDGPDAQSVIQAIQSRSGPAAGGSRRSVSVSIPAAPRRNSHASHASVAGNDREPSPTLPSLPTHPTLEALIAADAPTGAPPRIGDPGKRMVGHALGVRHPGLAGRIAVANESLQRAMGGLTIAE